MHTNDSEFADDIRREMETAEKGNHSRAGCSKLFRRHLPPGIRFEIETRLFPVVWVCVNAGVLDLD